MGYLYIFRLNGQSLFYKFPKIIKEELPKWLLELNNISLIINNFENLNIRNMIIDLDNEEEIELFLDDDGLKISYGSSEGYIQTLPVEEFPIINKNIKEKYFSIKQ